MLKTGEAGAWKPSLNLSTLLISLRALLSSPNPDDPLDADIVREGGREGICVYHQEACINICSYRLVNTSSIIHDLLFVQRNTQHDMPLENSPQR